MIPYYTSEFVTLYHGDCRKILTTISGASAIVTDPPYELGFMGKKWDSRGISFQVETWEIVRSACLPGASMLSFGGTRTQHRIACAIEDAGWELRDTLMWVYGTGFPKSLAIGKTMDKLQGKERDWISINPDKASDEAERASEGKCQSGRTTHPDITRGNTVWEGYGTALKPAYEPIILAMNPLAGTFANNALKHGVAGLNIEECRIGIVGDRRTPCGADGKVHRTTGNTYSEATSGEDFDVSKGRFPANFIHDVSQEVMELCPDRTGMSSGGSGRRDNSMFGVGGISKPDHLRCDAGSAARFFYCAKASKAERNRGCEELEVRDKSTLNEYAHPSEGRTASKSGSPQQNNHPTVKPLALMTYLVKLVKMPEYNLVIDPFCGSGTTLLACIRLGIPCIGIDDDEQSCKIAAHRCRQETIDILGI